MNDCAKTAWLAVCAACAAALLALLPEDSSPALPASAASSPRFAVEDAVRISISRGGRSFAVLERDGGGWNLAEPFKAGADAVAVTRLLDGVAAFECRDRLSPEDMRELDRTPRDFGFAPPRAAVEVTAGTKVFLAEFGGDTPFKTETYVRTEKNGAIFTVPHAVLDSIPAEIGGFRRRNAFPFPFEMVSAADFKEHGSPLLRISRASGEWQIVQPENAPADPNGVREVLSGLLALRVTRFAGGDWAAQVKSGAEPDAATLERCGLAGPGSFSVAVWTSPSVFEKIVFGAAAGADEVYALVHGGTAVAVVPKAVADLCRAGRDGFLDERIFPFGADSVLSVSVSLDGSLHTVARGSDGEWRLEAPAVAPVDANALSELMGCVLSLKHNERVPEGEPAAMVSICAGAPAFRAPTNLAPVAVRRDLVGNLSNLRSKTVISLDPDAVRRLSVVSAGGDTVVERDGPGSAWRLAKTTATAPAISVAASAESVERVLKALSPLSAVSVESMDAAPEDFRRCGLSKPAFSISAETDAPGVARRTLLLGGAAPGGGRYATAGGADAIFMVSREAVADLTVPLTESALERQDRPVSAAPAEKEGKEETRQ